MSDTYLRYVPIRPSFVPEGPEIAKAEDFVRRRVNGESIGSRATAKIEFVDAGGNWEGVRCPQCGADAEPWWSAAMSSAFEQDFEDLMVRAACCQTYVALNELHYGWPVAFGRYVLEIANPSASGLTPAEKDQLGSLLGCPVNEVWFHI